MIKRKSVLFRALIMALAIIMIVETLPFYAFAYKEKETPEVFVPADPAVEPVSEEEKPAIIGELSDKRKSDSKSFLMSDGSILTAAYPYDIHYEAGNSFKNIDNSLREVKDPDGEAAYSNKANIFDVFFKSEGSENGIYSLRINDHLIKVSLDGSTETSAEIISSDTDFETGIEKELVLKNITSGVKYRDVFENVDLSVSAISTRIKENIVIKAPTDRKSVTYTFSSEDLVFEQTDEKTVTVFDKEGNKLFDFSAPAIWDAKGDYSENSALTLGEQNENYVKLTLDWSNADISDMTYPVTVDPVISFQLHSTFDTFVSPLFPNSGRGSWESIAVSSNIYGLLQFTDLNLKAGDRIVSAQIYLTPICHPSVVNYTYNSDLSCNNDFDPPVYITAHKILGSWDETSTYSSLGSFGSFYDQEVVDYRILDGDYSVYSWDVTRIVNEWTSGISENHGILFKFDHPAPDNPSIAFFVSADIANPVLATTPKAVYQYINTTGVESYFSAHTHSAGYAGNVAVNDYTGNLTLEVPLVSTGGLHTPIDVSLVYNTNDVNSSDTPYGAGWKLNWYQTLEQISVTDVNNNEINYIKYKDADGTEHYFTADDSTGNNWSDEIYEKRKLTKTTVNNEPVFEMTDGSGMTLKFKKPSGQMKWYLYESSDEYGNSITVVFDAVNNTQITGINTSNFYYPNHNVIDFVYSNGFLDKVIYYDSNSIDPQKIKIYYGNSGSSKVVSDITYYYKNENEEYDYSYKIHYLYYGNTAYLSRAVDIDGSYITYSYTSDEPKRVSYVAEYGTDGVLGGSASISYETTSTTYTDILNSRKYLYTFASNGTLKSVVDVTDNDGNGYGQYYEFNNGNTATQKGKGNLTFISKTQKSAVNLLSNHSFENSGYNNFTVWGTNNSPAASASYSSEKAYIGSRSVKLSRPSGNTSSRVLSYAMATLTAGQKYTFSAYVNTYAMTSAVKGATLFIYYSNGDNTYSFESEAFTEKTGAYEWKRIFLSFTPEYSGSASICVSLSNAYGTVYFDNIQLEKGDLSEYNLLENAGFEKDTGNTPYGWDVSSNGGNTVSGSYAASGNNAYHFTGEITKHKHLVQYLSVSGGRSGDTYVASAFAKARSVPATGSRFTLLVRFINNGNTVNDVFIPFNSYTTKWQKVSGLARANGSYTMVSYWFLYYGNCNEVYFDNAQLIKDTYGSTYTYDSNGNVITTVDLEGKEEYKFTYNGNNRLIGETNIVGSKILYTYNKNKKNELQNVTSAGVSTSYYYDNKGNVTLSHTEAGIDASYFYIQSYTDPEKYLCAENNDTNLSFKKLDRGNERFIWYLSRSGNTYKIYNEWSNKCISAVSSTVYDGGSLGLYSSGSKPYQSFYINEPNKGVFYFTFPSGEAITMEDSTVIIRDVNEGVDEVKLVPVPTAQESLVLEGTAIQTAARYSPNKEYLTKYIDPLDNITQYSYNESRGYLTSVTDAKNNTTTYTYNANELITQLQSGNVSVDYAYGTDNRLSTITSPSGTVYSLFYDNFGRSTDVKIGTRYLSTKAYNSKGQLSTLTYGNGDVIGYDYDALGRIVSARLNGNAQYAYNYDGSSRLVETKDLVKGLNYKYTYDHADRLISEKQIDSSTGNVKVESKNVYDTSLNRLTGYSVNINGVKKTVGYNYYSNESIYDSCNGYDTSFLTGIKLNGNTAVTYKYDNFARLSNRTVNGSYVVSYGYLSRTNPDYDIVNTSTVPDSYTDSTGTYKYYYDANYNITGITKDGDTVATYAYDSLNQLVREDIPDIGTYVYTYDNGGNRLSTKQYPYNDLSGSYTTIGTYTYGDSTWKDLLTAYNGVTVTYDSIGNPTSYRGKSMEWTNGRELASVTVGGDEWTYTYNIDGIRTGKSKANNSGTYSEEYVIVGGKIVAAKQNNGTYVYFYYDESGNVLAMEYGGNTYYYLHNIQGDVTGLIDSNNTVVVKYNYDAWGKILSTSGTLESTLGNVNPFRYRGYYYDTETGFYYLNSRYYDPETGRFINADGLISTGTGILGCNMFAYCENNPVIRVDPEGDFWWIIPFVIFPLLLTGCSESSSDSKPRDDLIAAPDLDIKNASPTSYNCYGNGIGKQIVTNPTGYKKGDSTAKTFEAVKKDLGGDKNVRRLESIDSPIGKDEFKVAMKCGPIDYHFIRLDNTGWYNKSGKKPGLYINKTFVNNDIWYAMWKEKGIVYYNKLVFYNDETIYFAVKKGWDK